MQLFYRIFYYPIRLLDWAGTRTVRLFGLHPSSEHASIYTESELRHLIDVSRRSGHLEKDEQELINGVFEFSNAEVREAMIPRISVAAIPVTATLDESKDAFRQLGYSRLPVYRDRLDNVLGILFRRDLEPYLDQQPLADFTLEALVHAPKFIPATARLGAALKQMQASCEHLSIVVDEHGGMEGIITLEDLLEEIVGEIADEYDEEVRSQISKDTNDTYLLSGMLTVRDANRQLKLQLPEDGGYITLAGFLLAQAGRLLNEGETVKYERMRFMVEQIDKRRIRKIRLTIEEDKQISKLALVPLISTAMNESFLIAPMIL